MQKLTAKKSLGQHFLTSKAALDQIISAAQLKEGEIVLEIGPGTGILTRALLNTGVHIFAVEKDDRALHVLQETFKNEISSGKLHLIHGDILSADLIQQFSEIKDGAFALVANIPYYITGAILERFLEHGPRPNRMVLLVQKEVAERIVARDGKESILSISVKAFGVPNIVAKVPRGAFNPPPKVDSAILSIENISHEQFIAKNIPTHFFFEVVRTGFAHKRKFAIRNLEAIAPIEKLDALWSQEKIDPKIRPEDLTLGQWILIASTVV